MQLSAQQMLCDIGLRIKQRVDGGQVGFSQSAGGLTQFELAQQDVITCLGQITFGLEQLALAVEYIDVDANTHLISQLVGIQGALA